MPFQKKLLPALIAMFVAMPANAEETNKGETTLNKVMVTANKMEEDVNKVPQSITVIDEHTLVEKGVKNIQDVIKEVPNMTNVQSFSRNEVSFRGLSPSVFTNNNPVVIYVDGVPTSSSYTFDASMANVEQIEVLRGPQGSLYGKDAIGAVINVITKDPENTWSGDVGVEYGTDNYMFGTFNANGALIKDKLFMGVNGQGSKDDGWIENENPNQPKKANDKEDYNVAAYLLFKPTDRLRAKLSLSKMYNKANWYDGYAQPGSTSIDDFDRDDAEKVNFDVDQFETRNTDAQSLSLSYDFDQIKLDSITTHQYFDMDTSYDVDFGNAPLYAGLKQLNGQKMDTWTQELRVSSQNQEGFRWVGGLYFETSEHKQDPYGFQFPNFDMTDPNNPVYIGNYEIDAKSTTDSTTKAAFGQLIVPLADRLELSMGARLQRIEKEIDLDTFFVPLGGSKDTPFYELKTKKEWDAFLPKLALAYELNDSWNTYASYAKGYMPGGFNFFGQNGDAEANTFDPQTSDNYELGVKAEFENLRLSANVFYMDIQDIHIYRSQGNLYFTDNAERAHSYGTEVQASYFVTDDIELSGSAGFLDAKYDDYEFD